MNTFIEDSYPERESLFLVIREEDAVVVDASSSMIEALVAAVKRVNEGERCYVDPLTAD